MYYAIYKNRLIDIPPEVDCKGMRYMIFLKEPRKRLEAVYITNDLQDAKKYDIPGKELSLCPIVARLEYDRQRTEDLR